MASGHSTRLARGTSVAVVFPGSPSLSTCSTVVLPTNSNLAMGPTSMISSIRCALDAETSTPRGMSSAAAAAATRARQHAVATLIRRREAPMARELCPVGAEARMVAKPDWLATQGTRAGKLW